jgi:hypothetical protein
MDFSFLLIADAVILIGSTLILTYFFIREILKNKKKKKL